MNEKTTYRIELRTDGAKSQDEAERQLRAFLKAA